MRPGGADHHHPLYSPDNEGAKPVNNRKISAIRPALPVRHGAYVQFPDLLASFRRYA